MSAWDLRQWIESRIPGWVEVAIVIVAFALVGLAVWKDGHR